MRTCDKCGISDNPNHDTYREDVYVVNVKVHCDDDKEGEHLCLWVGELCTKCLNETAAKLDDWIQNWKHNGGRIV